MAESADVAALILRALHGEGISATPHNIVAAATRLARAPADHRALMLFCDSFLKAAKNLNYDHKTNGEHEILRRYAALRPKIVFDAGANEGEWALMAAAELPDAIIHAFEIVPDTFRLLAAKAAGQPRIKPNGFGLFEHAGELKINAFAASDKLASFVDYPHGAARTIMCPVRTGGDYMREQGIDRVDFLKLDVEGAEHNILKGFGTALDEGRIELVQFEYGKVNIITHFLLRDFYDYFTAKNYTVGKIYPDYVDFRDYTLDDEDFLGPNYLACRGERTDIIALLGARR